MNKYKFVMTKDGSAGLYNEDLREIYHSNTGAAKEACEKFVNPVIKSGILKNKNEINILDICYGIGYNTKYTLLSLGDKLKINIDALESELNLIYLSPFIEDKTNDINLCLFLLSKIINENNNEELIKFIEDIIKENGQYFSNATRPFIERFSDYIYKTKGLVENRSFLHNIYYNYISNKYNSDINLNKYTGCEFSFKIGDARNTLSMLNNSYDVVFLDAFSPQKDPTLWTIDFLNLVKSKMNSDSILLSYSKSTPFRSALYNLGFFVGKTILNNSDIGTAASLNKNLIISPISDFDVSLFKTRAGIPYKDPHLILSPSQIIHNRIIESNSSDLISHTKFLKQFK